MKYRDSTLTKVSVNGEKYYKREKTQQVLFVTHIYSNDWKNTLWHLTIIMKIRIIIIITLFLFKYWLITWNTENNLRKRIKAFFVLSILQDNSICMYFFFTYKILHFLYIIPEPPSCLHGGLPDIFWVITFSYDVLSMTSQNKQTHLPTYCYSLYIPGGGWRVAQDSVCKERHFLSLKSFKKCLIPINI